MSEAKEENNCTSFCKSFSLDHEDASLFCKSQWKWPQPLYIAYKVIIFCYFFAWLVVAGVEQGTIKFLLKADNITLLILLISLLAQLYGAIWYYVSTKKDGSIELKMFWLLKLSWCFYTATFSMAVVMTIFYYSKLYTLVQPMEMFDVALDVNTHAVIAAYLVVDIFMVALPIRPAHVLYTMLFAVAYHAMVMIYTLQTGIVLYTFLDWLNKPVSAAITCSLINTVHFVCHFILYILYRLRLFISEKCTCCSDYKAFD